MTTESSAALRERHDALIAAEPQLRIRERAARLGVSEAELIAADCGVTAIALQGAPRELFLELGKLGRVMALSRNDHCVHERHGAYTGIDVGEGPVGLVLGPDIDLRMFFSSWASAWAVTEHGRHSLQFFDKAGTAIHKVYRTEHTDAAAWDAYVTRFASEARPALRLEAFAAPDEADAPEDAAALRAHWLALEDTHDFFVMLRKFRVSRLGALAAAGEDLAQQVPDTAVETLLEAAAARALPIMCFVGNRGIVQIHTGPVSRLQRTGPWFNVLDADFNLHLDTRAITSCWVVNKPTRDGWVTSLEVYAASGEMIVQFFGARKPGAPELPAWRELLQGLCPEPLAA
ncbi:MAG: ChuX/HutX family heme-like substrate-binding protein [Candidatus Dactylopiibacterium sp.]|nr:ChuX/HutX family heme-like substrate-binding protein [Candidatus Dactylopiibacterium sp.]